MNLTRSFAGLSSITVACIVCCVFTVPAGNTDQHSENLLINHSFWWERSETDHHQLEFRVFAWHWMSTSIHTLHNNLSHHKKWLFGLEIVMRTLRFDRSKRRHHEGHQELLSPPSIWEDSNWPSSSWSCNIGVHLSCTGTLFFSALQLLIRNAQ